MSASRRNAAIAFACAAMAGAAAPATAAIATHIQGFMFDQNYLAFTGKVTSPNKHCIAGRSVTITRFDGQTPTTIGTATTKADGTFSFPDATAQAGTYEATVAAKKVKRHKHRYNCGAGTTGQQPL